MQIIVDADSRRLSLGPTPPVRGETIPGTLTFMKGGVPFRLPAGTAIQIGVKSWNDPSDVLLAYTTATRPEPDGAPYTFSLSLNTAEMLAKFTAGVTRYDCSIEVKWEVSAGSGTFKKTQRHKYSVDADTVRDTDANPSTMLSRNDFLVTNGTGLLVNVAAGYAANGAFVAAQASLAITNATNYIEVTAAGVASVNTTAFTAGSYPLATVVASAGAITSNTDLRAWITPKPAAAGGVTSITGTANEITVTGTTTPTLSLPSALTFTGKTVTGGTFNSGAFNGTLGGTTPDVVNTTGLNVKDSGGTTTASIDGADGTASFLGGNLVITNSPYNQIAASGLILYIDTVIADDGLWINDGVNPNLAGLEYDGTAQFKSGAITLGKNTGTVAWIDDDGSASFGNGNCTIDSGGGFIAYSATLADSVTIGANAAAGTLNVKNSSGTTTASIDGADGTASFLGGNLVITNSPSSQIAASNLSLYIDTVFAGNGLWINDGVNPNLAALEYDGTAQFKSGAITLGKNTGTAAWIDDDGSASFGNGNCTIDSGGGFIAYSATLADSVTIGANAAAGTLNVKDSGGTTTASISGADGSASFANGGLAIDLYGNITSNSNAEATLYNIHAANLLTVGTTGNDGTLNVKNASDIITATIYGADGSASFASGNVTIDTDGTLTLAGSLIGGTQSLTTSGGAGAVNLTTLTTEVETTGTLDVLTLADGTAGQIKVITHTVGAFTSVLTPTTALGFTTITFLASLGQTCTLEYTTAGWVILAVGGLTLPVVA